MLLLIKKKWRQVSKIVNGWTVLNHGFEKWNLTLRTPSASFVAVKLEHIDMISNSHYASNKHQRNAVPHYTMREHGDAHGDFLNFGFQKRPDSSSRLFRFAFVNSFVDAGGCRNML